MNFPNWIEKVRESLLELGLEGEARMCWHDYGGIYQALYGKGYTPKEAAAWKKSFIRQTLEKEVPW